MITKPHRKEKRKKRKRRKKNFFYNKKFSRKKKGTSKDKRDIVDHCINKNSEKVKKKVKEK